MKREKGENMKRISKLLLTGGMALCMFGLMTGCGENGISLSYGTGETAAGEVYGEYYYRNDASAFGADPGVMYVSKEQDETYGGYYYMYTSAEAYDPGGIYATRVCLAHMCWRSDDLTSWEQVGVHNGYALESAVDDWTLMCFYAPEVVYVQGKYYMYYSAQQGYTNNRYTDSRTQEYKRFQLAIAVSDTPVGPFELVRSGTDADGNEITNAPRVDIAGHFGLSTSFAAIDSHMFIDDGGEMYLLFNKHADDSPYQQGVWGIRMKDPVTPDYDTLTCLTIPSQKSVKDYPAGTVIMPEGSGALGYDEGRFNEGPFLYKHGGKYYLTYSMGGGYGAKGYCVMQAVSDSVLGTYVKPDIGKGNPVIVTTGDMFYMSGTGHHSMLPVGNELYTVYAYHANAASWTNAAARVIGKDRLAFTEINGETLLVCNGPTLSAQPLPASLSGYENFAQKAAVTVSGGEGKEYLTDGLLTVSDSLNEREFISDGAVTVTLTFDTAVDVRAVMVYNSSDYLSAFSCVDEIRLDYEKAKQVNGGEYTFGTIEKLEFPKSYVNIEDGYIYRGAAAVADFNVQTGVKKITLKISQKFVTQDFDGSPLKAIGISEIVVF